MIAVILAAFKSSAVAVFGWLWTSKAGRIVLVCVALIVAGYVFLHYHDAPMLERISVLSDSLAYERTEYSKLLGAKLGVDSTLERERREEPPVIIVYRPGPAVVDSSAVESLLVVMDADRREFAREFARRGEYVPLVVDTTVRTKDTVDVRIRLFGGYSPTLREFDLAWFPYVDVLRWRVSRGYLIRDTVRFDWSLNLMAGWSANSPAGQVSLWRGSYGIGASTYQRHGPAWWVGWKLTW